MNCAACYAPDRDAIRPLRLARPPQDPFKPEDLQKLLADLHGKQTLSSLKTRTDYRTGPIEDVVAGIRKALGEKEYKARHILVDTEDEAKAIIAKLNKGEKFEDLAKQSKDPGSKDKGGDLGWANQAAYVKPFSEAMTKLEKGKFTAAPVKSDFGWHVIQLDDVRDLKAPSLDEIKPQLTQRLQQQMVEKHILELRTKAKVE